MNIVLTGFMASGKSTTANEIAKLSDYTPIDTDSMIEEKAGMSINEIFEKYGEAHFRRLEKEICKEAAKTDKTVIATGGGAVLDKENIKILRSNGKIFNLSPDFSVIEKRYEKARETRPLMMSESIENIRKRFDDRQQFYDDCDYKIHITDETPPQIYAQEILKFMEEV